MMESEAERAAFYQAHKDDAEVWGKIERPKRRGPKKRLTATITVRFSADETDLIRREAERRNLSYSEVVRRAVRTLGQPWHAEPGTTTNLFFAGRPDSTQEFEFEPERSPDATRTGRMLAPT